MKMKIVAIIQARMGSTRLPGKVLKEISGKPILWHVINRVKNSQKINDLIVATSIDKKNDVIRDFCQTLEITCFSGSENDLLDRYYQVAKNVKADAIVRITADCPVIDPEIIDEVIKFYLEGKYDIAGLAGEFPDGLDTTIFSFHTLEDAWKNANLLSEREHVGPYMDKHPEKFKIGHYKKFHGLGKHRWCVDEVKDLKLIREIYSELYKEGEIFHTKDILNLLKKRPELMNINKGIIRNEGHLKSLENDKEII